MKLYIPNLRSWIQESAEALAGHPSHTSRQRLGECLEFLGLLFIADISMSETVFLHIFNHHFKKNFIGLEYFTYTNAKTHSGQV